MGKEKTRGVLGTLTSALLYGFTPCICSITYLLGNNHTSMTFFRSLLTLPAFLAVIMWKKIDLRVEKRIFGKLLLTANLWAFITTRLLDSSNSYIPVGTATTLHFLYPLLVVVFNFCFYKDKLTRKKVLSIVYAAIGILLFLINGGLGNIKGILLAFASSVTFALYMMLLDKWKLSEMDGYKLMFYVAAIVSAEMWLINFKTGFLIFDQPLQVYGLMLSVALMASFAANILLKEGIRILGSTMASFLSLLEPISSILFGMIFLREAVSLLQVMGCGAIILSIVNLLGSPRKVENETYYI